MNHSVLKEKRTGNGIGSAEWARFGISRLSVFVFFIIFLKK